MNLTLESWIASFVFAGMFLAGRWLDSSQAVERFRASRRYISAAAGISVGYIFVDVLPELEFQRSVVVKAAGETTLLFSEQRIYVLALLSFVVVYGLEHMVLVTHQRQGSAAPKEGGDPTYWLQLAGYGAYSALIGYLLLDRAGRGTFPLLVYTFAMAVHFRLVDHALSEEHGDPYTRHGRVILAASVLGGCLIATVTPLSEVLVARLFAVLAGGVVITSLRAELPDDRNGRFWPFCIAAVVFAGILIVA